MDVQTTFLTYHHSGKDLHLRTHDGILWITKDNEELQEKAKGLKRGQKIKAKGEQVVSKTLSTMVVQISDLEAA